MPEGHTLHRLALELDREFGRSVPNVSSPQGRFAESSALLNGRENRIDTIREEHTPGVMGRDPRVHDHGGEVCLYRRHDLPCWVCGPLVKTKVVEGRNLFWCGRCQRRG